MSAGSYPPGTGSSTPTADQYLRVGDTVLRYRDEGYGSRFGNGPAVLLVHGWTLDLDMWEPQVQSLYSSFRLVRFDRRGFGLSTGHPCLSTDAQDALALCQHLGIRRFACVGMSQGARVVLHLCRLAPERVFCMVLDGPPDPCGAPGEPAARAERMSGDQESADVPLTEYRQLIAREGVESFRQRWEAHPLMQLRTSNSHSRELLHRMLARYPATDLLQEPTPLDEAGPPGAAARRKPQPGEERQWDPAALASLRMPSLVISGEHDLPGRRRAADNFASILAHAERAVIGGAGHLPNLDSPVEYNAVLQAFLGRHSRTHNQESTHA